MQKGDELLNHQFKARLQEEFSRRLRSNEQYSLRAFAAHLGIDSSSLSKILAGKRPLSEAKINDLCQRIGLENPKKASGPENFAQIEVDRFSVIADWYHFAILDLVLLKAFKPDAKWIARKLSIEPHNAMGAVERLKRLGLLVEKEGRLVKGESFYTNYSEGVTSAALKEYQRQVIKKALVAVDDCPQDRKDITSITIAADSRKLKVAKEKIKKFRRELCAFLEDGESDSVFHLALQLYPVTEIEN
ncbi:MAG: TIGR02147 family protein [Bdellovibrionota bacterium]